MSRAARWVLFEVVLGLLGIAAGIVTTVLWWPAAHGWQHDLLILFLVSQIAASGSVTLFALVRPLVGGF